MDIDCDDFVRIQILKMQSDAVAIVSKAVGFNVDLRVCFITFLLLDVAVWFPLRVELDDLIDGVGQIGIERSGSKQNEILMRDRWSMMDFREQMAEI